MVNVGVVFRAPFQPPCRRWPGSRGPTPTARWLDAVQIQGQRGGSNRVRHMGQSRGHNVCFTQPFHRRRVSYKCARGRRTRPSHTALSYNYKVSLIQGRTWTADTTISQRPAARMRLCVQGCWARLWTVRQPHSAIASFPACSCGNGMVVGWQGGDMGEGEGRERGVAQRLHRAAQHAAQVPLVQRRVAAELAPRHAVDPALHHAAGVAAQVHGEVDVGFGLGEREGERV